MVDPAPPSDGWVRVAPADDLPGPGDHRAVRAGAESVLVVRDRDGRLRAFYNVCRHRGHELLEPGPTRTRGAIRCPYHAWVYALDGRLAATPRFGEAAIDRDRLPLVPVPLRERDGWLLVRPLGEPGGEDAS